MTNDFLLFTRESRIYFSDPKIKKFDHACEICIHDETLLTCHSLHIINNNKNTYKGKYKKHHCSKKKKIHKIFFIYSIFNQSKKRKRYQIYSTLNYTNYSINPKSLISLCQIWLVKFRAQLRLPVMLFYMEIYLVNN